MWKVFQITIAAAVAFSNAHWQWTDNGMVVGLAALLAAGFATAILSAALDAFRSRDAGKKQLLD